MFALISPQLKGSNGGFKNKNNPPDPPQGGACGPDCGTDKTSKAKNFQTIAAKSLLSAKEQYSFLNNTSMKIDISSSDTIVLFNT